MSAPICASACGRNFRNCFPSTERDGHVSDRSRLDVCDVGCCDEAYGRLVAGHFGKPLPGKPNVVPQNMSGDGRLKAANYLYSVAPKDGSVIGTFSRSQGIAPLLDKAEFDSTKFTW